MFVLLKMHYDITEILLEVALNTKTLLKMLLIALTYLFIYKVSISYLIASVNLRMGTLALITIVFVKNAEIDQMYNCVNEEI